MLHVSPSVYLDKLIAEHVFGITDFSHLPTVYEEGNTPDGKDGWSGFVCPRCRRPEDLLSEPCCQHYSSDISAAWEVVEKIVGKDCKANDLFIECWSDGEWFVAFRPVGYSSRNPSASCDGKFTGVASMPLAVCRAALKWKQDA